MNVQLTDERLKYGLNTQQSARERLCCALLGLTNRYSNIQPRRPEGGPDGGRDLEAILDGSIITYGAVGFINNATDSRSDKRNIIKKFNSDLHAALQAKSDLKSFVFFTNIDLTPAECDRLKSAALNRGVQNVEIFWREAIRAMLDLPSGYGLRFTYLSIPLNEAEQHSFFDTYGKQLEDIISNGNDRILGAVQRLEFLHRMSRPITSISVGIQLNKYTESFFDIGHFRILGKIFTLPEGSGRTWYLGAADYHSGDKPRESFGIESFYSFDGKKRALQQWSRSGIHQPYYDYISASIDSHGALMHENGMPITPEILERMHLKLFVTENLVSWIKEISLTVNGNRILRMPKYSFTSGYCEVEWPKLSASSDWSPKWMMLDSMSGWISIEHTAYQIGKYPNT